MGKLFESQLLGGLCMKFRTTFTSLLKSFNLERFTYKKLNTLNGSDKRILTQWGSEGTPFSAYQPNQIFSCLEDLNRFISEFKVNSGLEVFLTYGGLLGAVREGSLIDDDFDLDLCIIFEEYHDEEQLVEQFLSVIQNIPFGDGVLDVQVVSATQYALSCVFGGISVTVDLFLGWFKNGLFYQAFSIDERFQIKIDDIYPIKLIQLNGSYLPIPNSPEKLLVAIYGDDWYIPKPDFNYMGYFTQLGGLPPSEHTVFGRVSYNKKYWDSYYSGDAKQQAINHLKSDWLFLCLSVSMRYIRRLINNIVTFQQVRSDLSYIDTHKTNPPSQFAVFSESWLNPFSSILEVGSGNGRDLKYFLDNGHSVHATDFSESACKLISNLGIKFSYEKLLITKLDYADSLRISEFSIANQELYDCFYARFLFHAVTEVSQFNLIRMAQQILKVGGLFCAEFRTAGHSSFDKAHDWDELELTGTHYRRPLDYGSFIEYLTKKGFEVSYTATGNGYAYHRDEDPVVTRIVAIRR